MELPNLDNLKSLDLLETFSIKTETNTSMDINGMITTKTYREESFKLKSQNISNVDTDDHCDDTVKTNGYIKISKRIKREDVDEKKRIKSRLKMMSIPIDPSPNKRVKKDRKRKKFMKYKHMDEPMTHHDNIIKLQSLNRGA